MANKTLGQLTAAVIEQVERVAGECNVDVARFINKGLLELAIESDERKSASVSVVNGEGTLPTDCLFLVSVYKDGIGIPMVNSDSQDMDQAVTTTSWMISGGKLKILPAETDTFEAVYAYSPATLALDADTPTMQAVDDYLIAYAIWHSLAQLLGPVAQTSYWNQEAEREKLLWKRLNGSSNRRPRFIRYRSWA